jgi:TP901 family phage tail tape measure protein
MSFNAGEVYALLGGKFNAAGFNEFDRRVKGSAATMESSEKRIAASSQRTSDSLNKVGHAAKVGAGVGLLGLASIVAYSTKQAADFEAQMRNVNSIAQLSEGRFRKLSAEVKGLAGQTAQSPKVLAAGLYQLVSSGFKAGESIQILHAAAIAASAGLTDTETSVTALAAVLNAYHLPAGKATEVSDQLFQTVNRGVITFEELAHTIGDVLPFAATLHVGLDQVGASISTMTKAGISAPETMTRIKTSLEALIKPSKGMQAAFKELGVANGEQLIKQKGFQGALEALVHTAGGSKEAIAKLFPNIRALGGVLALTGSNAKGAEQDVKAFGDTAGAAQKVFAEQSKGAAFQLREAKAQIDQAAISLGSHFLPILASGAQHLAAFVQHLDETGQLDSFAQGIIHGGQEAGQVIGDLAHIAGAAVGPLIALGRALDLGDASHIEAIAGAFIGFKAASAAASGISRLSEALAAADAAAAGQNLKLLPFLLTKASPVTAAAVAVGALGAALILLGGNESEETSLANANAAAHKAQAEAIKSVSDAEHASADAGLALKQAHLDEKQAQEHINELRKQGKTHTDAYRQAVIDLERATLRAGDAQKQYGKNLDDQNEKGKALVKTAKDNLDAARKEFDQLSKPVPRGPGRAGVDPPAAQASRLRDQAQAQQQLVARTQDYIAAVARANVSDANRTRLMSASRQITAQNVQGVSDLVNVIKNLPASKQAKILVQNQDALAKLGDLSTRLGGIASQKTIRTVIAGAGSAQSALLALTAIAKGVPAQKVTHVLAQTGSARAEIAAILGLIASLPASKTTVLTTVHVDRHIGSGAGRRAAGRGPEGSERALVGEGAGPEYVADPITGAIRKVTAPTILDLKPTDYVIPAEDRYRGRALGLLADLMRDLGIPAYGGGKGNKKKSHRIVPPAPKDYHVADPDVLQSEIDRLKQLADQKDKSGKHPTAKAKEAKRELPAIRAAYRKAHAAKVRIDANAERADNAHKALDNADKRDDQHAFDKALTAYQKALKGEQGGLETIWEALGRAGKQDTSYGRKIKGLLLGVKGDAFDATKLVNQPEQDSAGQVLSDTGLTPEETARLARINRDIALAALTPDLGDDQTAAGALVDLLQGALTADLGGRNTDPSVITDLAGQLKTAKDNLASFTGGSGASNTNPDLQAQLDQVTRQRDNAIAESQINAQALSVFKGFTDVGTGVTINQTINTLHPGDPTTQRAIGDASVAGISLQPARKSPKVVLGA